MNSPRPHHERRMVACVAIQASQAPLEMRQYDSPTHAVEEAIDLFRTDEDLCVLASVLDTGGSEEAWQAQQRHVEGLLRELGQPGLFITLPVQDMVRHLLTEDVIYEDFGVVAGDATHRSERIYAVIHADLPQPARSVAKKAGNLPRPNRSFVGRESEVARLQSLLIDRTLVTVLGPPGVGKSALTLHVARSLVDECEDGAWWFPVDDCASLDELLARMAREPGMIEMPGVATPRRVAEALGPKHALLVLDGGERLRTDVAQLCEHLLQCCPNVTTVVTSCERLEIEGEFIFNVLPLSLGDDQSEMNEYTLLTSDALNLLYERASQSGVLLPMSTSAIEKAMRICRQADGLPMYIELLASALRHTSLEGLERSLLEVGGICTHADGSVATKASEQVFRAGFAMLPEAERALLGRLSLFTTGWDIEAVGAVLGDAGTEVDQLAELHKSLFERSWISYDTDLDRYRMLKPLRAFLIRRQPSSALHQHVRGLATLASTWTAGLEGARSARCTMLLDQHYADFVVALELALEEPKLEQEAGQLFQCLASYWVRRNILEDAMQFASKSLRHGQGLLFARAAMMAGVVALRRRQYSRAAQSFEDARLACSRLSYSVGEAVALCNQAMAMSDSGHIDEALAVYEDGLNFMRAHADKTRLASALNNAAEAYLVAAEVASDAQRQELALKAELLVDEAWQLRSKDPIVLQAIHHNLGRLNLLRNELDRAETEFRTAICLCDEERMKHEAFQGVAGLAEIALRHAEHETSAKCLGLALSIIKEAGHTPTDEEVSSIGSMLARLRSALGQHRVEKLMRYGSKLELAELKRYQLPH